MATTQGARGHEILALVLERDGEVKAAEEVMKAAASNTGRNAEIMALFLKRKVRSISWRRY